ncbi:MULTISPECIES: hypothetical protein [unclassified Nostoc]|nr:MULTISPECIES: hypothetical protein [unclassified Nostoc]MBN3875605.1 hypothetical protein [Nostoc sp. JL23]MBN3893165.1 hypothetical protein [Nostoc sp. JL31]
MSYKYYTNNVLYWQQDEETGHSVISLAELGEQWLWCFLDEQAKNY